MENFKLIQPEDRFDKIISEYRKDRIDPNSQPVFPADYDLPFTYSCPKCNYNISIKNNDLKVHYKSDFTNFNTYDKERIESFIKENDISTYSFLDFYCPRCASPVRVFFDMGLGGYFGMTYILKYVIEF